MPRRKTQEEYENEVHAKMPYIDVIGRYITERVKIKHHCNKHDVWWDVAPFNILQHASGCPSCQQEIMDAYYTSRRKTDEQFKAEVAALGTGIKPLGVYRGTHEHMDFECNKNHIWNSTPHDILDGYGCPYCAGNAVWRGYNDLWTTHPEIAKMLTNPDEGYEVSKGSHKKVSWTCPDCGTEKITSPKQVVKYGLACSKCSNTISYPNRLIISLLQQLDVDEIHPEWSPEWIGKCRYDVYFVYKDVPYIVEMDGGIGHGGVQFGTNEVDVDGVVRDQMKDEQAKLHDICLVRIDCRYEQKDIKYRLQYIQSSILNSELSNILPLNDVDWDKCNKDATKSLHMEAAKQYDAGRSIREISKDLNVSYSAVYEWLKRLAAEGLCSYKPVIGYNPSCKKTK